MVRGSGARTAEEMRPREAGRERVKDRRPGYLMLYRSQRESYGERMQFSQAKASPSLCACREDAEESGRSAEQATAKANTGFWLPPKKDGSPFHLRRSCLH